ncbi:MAG: PDZ domain-containing protein, partial [Gillisia sp.]
DSLELYNAQSIYLKGLGEGEPVKAIKAVGNTVQIGEALNKKSTLYVVTDTQMSLSNRLGVPINGIIGYDFFKDFVVEFDFVHSSLKAYNPEEYRYKNCRRCSDFNLLIKEHKPYIEATAEIEEGKELSVKLLVDSGSSDAVWLFKNKKREIEVPPAFFQDFLGFGIGGSVYGKRSRIKRLSLGNLSMKDVTASFPDTLYFQNVKTFSDRDGSLGAVVLKRFSAVFDYGSNRLRLKPNRYFRDPFEYDMSGVVVAHSGFGIVKDLVNSQSPKKITGDYTGTGERVYQDSYQVQFSLQPQFKVVEIRPDSPAERAGLLIGDILVSLNGRAAYRYSLNDINSLLSSEEGKKIRLKINREGAEKEIAFRLERIL